jgi:hypothetical protein
VLMAKRMNKKEQEWAAGKKWCSKCKTVKDVSEYTRHPTSKDKLQSQCKACQKQHVQSQLESGYYLTGKGRISNLQRRSKAKGLEFSLTQTQFKAWWDETPDVCEYCSRSSQDYIELRDMLLTYSGSNSDLKIFQLVLMEGRNSITSNLTVDRKDNHKGYEIGNILKACWICNRVKGHMLHYEDMKLIGPAIISRLMKAIASE